MIRINQLPMEWVEPHKPFEFEQDILLRIMFRRPGASEARGVSVLVTERDLEPGGQDVVEAKLLDAIRFMLGKELQKIAK